MKEENKKVLKVDLAEAQFSKTYLFIKLKLMYYFFQRIFWSFFLRWSIGANIPLQFKDLKILRGEGGMFKSWVYFLCHKKKTITGSYVLVPGVGFGHCIFQLAMFRPKKIVAFDVYEYKEEWEYLTKICKEKFGVEASFFKGNFEEMFTNDSFDWIISDAVLEHVKDLDYFLGSSWKFLKEDGCFFASFGPIWYGPGGDHLDWGSEESLWDHLILAPAEYEKRFKKKKQRATQGTLIGDFLFQGRLFSYLRATEYFEKFKKNRLQFDSGFIKINVTALKILKKNKSLLKLLDAREVPQFDRFVDGFLVWLKK